MTLRNLAILLALLAATLPLGAQSPPKNETDRQFRECPECQDMVAIPAGKFLMGSPAHEPGRFDSEGPQHVVTVKAFALSKYPVTSGEFLAFLTATHYQPQPCNPLLGLGWRQLSRGLAATPTDVEPPRWPAVCLDWKDAEAFIAWINGRAKLSHPELGNRNPYRLPSEAEWEYAARAGTTTPFWWGDNDDGAAAYAWYKDNSDGKTHAVGLKPANPFGLYDMVGNVWQWTEDCYADNYAKAPINGSAVESPDGCMRVDRGSCWLYPSWLLRSATRERNPADFRDVVMGFRVARTLP